MRAAAGVSEVNLAEVGRPQETPGVPLWMTIGDFDPRDGSCRVLKYCGLGGAVLSLPAASFSNTSQQRYVQRW